MSPIEQQIQCIAHAANLLAARHRAYMLSYPAGTAQHRLSNHLGRAACRAQLLAVEQQHRPAYHRRRPAFVLAQLYTLAAQLRQFEQQLSGLPGAAGSPVHPAAVWPLDDLLASLAARRN